MHLAFFIRSSRFLDLRSETWNEKPEIRELLRSNTNFCVLIISLFSSLKLYDCILEVKKSFATID